MTAVSVSLFDPRPVTLEGTHVRLEPLGPQHAEDLCAAGRDEIIWRHLPRGPFAGVADARQWIDEALAGVTGADDISFAIVHRESGRAIGSTRFLEVRRRHRGLEIGWTWISTAHQRTPVNTECKYLLLRHCFEDLGALRVELKTDIRNERSQRAMERIGARREGIFRSHMLRPDNTVRDSVYYSVIADEWPQVRAHLERLLAR